MGGAGDGAVDAAPEAGPSPTTGSSGDGLAAWAGLVNFTLVLNMLLVAADRPPVLQVLFVKTDAMLSMSCTTGNTTIVVRTQTYFLALEWDSLRGRG